MPANKWKDEVTEQLCRAILALKSEEEAYAFIEDVATIGEIRAFAQRLEVARLLMKGYTYPKITVQSGASTATISRVKKCVEYGPDGFKTAFSRVYPDA